MDKIKNICKNIADAFAFAKDIVKDIVKDIADAICKDVVEAACKPKFTTAFSSIVILFLGYIWMTFLVALIVAAAIFMLGIIAALVLELCIRLPYVVLSIAGFFALLALMVKLIRICYMHDSKER